MTLHRCPRCDCDEPVSPPATSSARHRRALIAGVGRVIDSKRRARETVRPSEETPDE